MKYLLVLSTILVATNSFAKDKISCAPYKGELVNSGTYTVANVDGAKCTLSRQFFNSLGIDENFADICSGMLPRIDDTYGSAKALDGKSVTSEMVYVTVSEDTNKVIKLVRGGTPGHSLKVLCDETDPIKMPELSGRF